MVMITIFSPSRNMLSSFVIIVDAVPFPKKKYFLQFYAMKLQELEKKGKKSGLFSLAYCLYYLHVHKKK